MSQPLPTLTLTKYSSANKCLFLLIIYLFNRYTKRDSANTLSIFSLKLSISSYFLNLRYLFQKMAGQIKTKLSYFCQTYQDKVC